MVILVEAAFKGDHQSALFSIVAAQTAGFLQLEPGIGELGQNGVSQCLTELGIEAVGNPQQSAVVEAPLLDHVHQGLNGLLLSPGLVGGADFAFLGLTANPDAQDAGNLGNGGIDPAVSCQVGQRFQAEQGMHMVAVIPQLLGNGLQVQALAHQLPGLVQDHGHLGTGRHGINQDHLSAGMLFHIGMGSLSSGVVAAGNSLGNGGGKNHIGIAEGFQPLPNVGAGGTGLTLMGFQLRHHGGDIQLAVIHKFLVGNDFHRNAGKVLGAAQDVAAGIRNIFIIHSDTSSKKWLFSSVF